MWEIAAETVLEARHRIRGVDGEGGAVHEHRLTVRVVVRAEALDAVGWVLDFRQVEAALRELLAPWRGAFLNDLPPFDDVNPTRENLARVIAGDLGARLDDGRARVHRVDVSERGHGASYVTG
jgi:6-pyruvoyltetrahydropterin/6-carboxytetrahydropterin synthase